jgi:outer membrane receptor protein involved in Fe transport
MTFTKTNFSSYSIQLRGIGTQAISATVDPAVAVAFNNTPFIRNRFFEQEFYDLQRVEVLRGPQGTLYGRNATAGVVNLISAKPKFTYEAKLSADVGNYSSHRLEGMLNIPLAEDVAALRIAGAWTKRDGYAVNELTGKPIDGRDLWSTRVSLRFAPTDRLDANLIWEHFEENDDRIRSGKQLCKTHVVEEVAGFATPDFYGKLADQGLGWPVQSVLSQGCEAASLYSPDSFQKTNSLALVYYAPLGALGLPVRRVDGHAIDPYASATQTHDLRVIEAAVDPSYSAKTDVAELQVRFDLTDSLTINSETSWASDFIFSTQDYNRFAGVAGSWDTAESGDLNTLKYIARGVLSPEGVFCDPQIGCSDRLTAMDLSTARSEQFSQELRLASNYEGPFNFSVGGNFLRYDTEDKYYVFINSLSMISAFATVGAGAGGEAGGGMWVPGVTDNRDCLTMGMIAPDYTKVQPINQCTYVDPNPISNLNDLGHNYFLSRNPYKLISYAVFGEAYYQLSENLKVTGGIRWTVDKKEAPMRPSWLLASNTVGHPIVEVVEQEWSKPTGRLAVDWKPDLPFTDETMVYASLAHGYKAGGMNPPPFGIAIYTIAGNEQDYGNALLGGTAVHPKTFEPEYVDALELGAKNTLLDGAMTLNLAGFYYDYKGYQLSQIVNRSAVTHNFDADVWGLELEADWRAAENLKFGLKLGYEKTRVADGEQAIDVMDRTAGRDGWIVVKPFPSIPSNCVLPEWLFVGDAASALNSTVRTNPGPVGVGGIGGGGAGGCELAYLLNLDPVSARPYELNPFASSDGPGAYFRRTTDYTAWSGDIADYPCLSEVPTIGYPGVDPECLAAMSNNGEGFYKDLSGKELPNAPHITATITADYTLPLPSDWLMTLHTDLYYQSEAWTRIFNTDGYDKLKAYSNINLAAIFTNEDAGWKVMAYVKNVLDRDSITGAFLNSDDSGLTTNVFLTEPRLYGLRITKDFAGGPWWTGANLNHEGPFPLTVELGGALLRHDAPNETLGSDWVSSLPQPLALENVQNRDLDIGDGRSIKLTYRPAGSPWSLSASYREGEANTDTSRANRAVMERLARCAFPQATPELPLPYYDMLCVTSSPGYTPSRALIDVPSWSDTEARSHEAQSVTEFMVGYEVPGDGRFQSTIAGGVRSATLDSHTFYAANALSNWDIPDGYFIGFFSPAFLSSNHVRHLALDADREFRGFGPVGAWNAALPLWGDERTGRFAVDWTVSGGALFGERETTIVGDDVDEFHHGDLGQNLGVVHSNSPAANLSSALPVESSEVTPIDIRRSKNVTVPVVDLSLGFSYDVGRIKVSTGYRWERYFDVLDVGQDEAKDADRTIDGPYFKIAVGFGG